MWSSATASVSASTGKVNVVIYLKNLAYSSAAVFKISDYINYYKNLGGWSTAFGGLTEKAGTAFGAAKTKMANSFSHQNLSDEAVKVSSRFFNSFD